MDQDPTQTDAADERKPRRPYTPPRIAESAQFETLALTCGKLGGLACTRGGGANVS